MTRLILFIFVSFFSSLYLSAQTEEKFEYEITEDEKIRIFELVSKHKYAVTTVFYDDREVYTWETRPAGKNLLKNYMIILGYVTIDGNTVFTLTELTDSEDAGKQETSFYVLTNLQVRKEQTGLWGTEIFITADGELKRAGITDLLDVDDPLREVIYDKGHRNKVQIHYLYLDDESSSMQVELSDDLKTIKRYEAVRFSPELYSWYAKLINDSKYKPVKKIRR